MTLVRAMLIGVVIAAAMFLAVRHSPVEEQKAVAGPAISEQALRDYALRQAAVDALRKDEKPMVLPTLDPFPPDPLPAPPKPPPPKIEPPTAPPPTMVAMRPVERNLCSRFGMHKVQVDRWRWRCRR